MLTVLTATGERPQAWAICERLMMAQDYARPVRWVIVDDGLQAQPVTFQRAGWDLVIVRPEPYWQAGQNTQARNLRAGLAVIAADARVVVFEDDDWYAPDWLTTADAMLDKAELVGEPQARYYNVAMRKGRQLSNNAHASLCSTAMRGDALRLFRDVCQDKHKFIDMELWKRARSRHLFAGHRVVGIKGLPGRSGIGMGHAGGFVGQDDPTGALLREWVGEDARYYL